MGGATLLILFSGGGTVVVVAAADLLAAIKASYAADAPSAIPLNTVRAGQDKNPPYAVLTMDRSPRELMRTSTDIFSEVRICLRVYAGSLAAAADAAEPIAEWLDEHTFSYTTSGRSAVAGPFHRGEPKSEALKGRGREGVQVVQEYTFTGNVIRPRKQPIS